MLRFKLTKPPKGFVYMVCGKCGARRSFNLKEPSDYGYCKKCGGKTLLSKQSIRGVKVECECGKTYHYITNAQDDLLEIDCIECGTPMCVEYNKKTNRYENIRD